LLISILKKSVQVCLFKNHIIRLIIFVLLLNVFVIDIYYELTKNIKNFFCFITTNCKFLLTVNYSIFNLYKYRDKIYYLLFEIIIFPLSMLFLKKLVNLILRKQLPV